MKSADHDNTSCDCFGIVSDCYSSGKHVQFRQAGLAFSSKGSFIGKERNGGGYNLYYPSTISVERIEGARITLITVDTSSNIMRNALLTPPTSIVVASLIKIFLRVRHNIVFRRLFTSLQSTYFSFTATMCRKSRPTLPSEASLFANTLLQICENIYIYRNKSSLRIGYCFSRLFLQFYVTYLVPKISDH